jgi:N-acetylglutamate synthase-like GNAT family acetyltransferase
MPIVRPCRDNERPVLLHIINAAAQRYRGVIPVDCWHEPYMCADELDHEVATGVTFWGAELDGTLVGVMGMQRVLDVALIRHAYVAPEVQRRGLGGLLLAELCAQRPQPVLVGTWAAATWAICFYERHGFHRAVNDETAPLLRKYWSIPERQIEASVVLKRHL